jgi:hypothetical protein
MAQLGDLGRARILLRRAGQAFGSRETASRARCLIAEAEIALVSRDLNWPAKALDEAHAALEGRGDLVNSTHALYLKARYLVLIGRIEAAERLLPSLNPALLSPPSRAAHALLVAGIAMRRLQIKEARRALNRAASIARNAGIPALIAEVESSAVLLHIPAARLIASGAERLLRLADVEEVLASDTLVIDCCRHAVHRSGRVISLKTRPVLLRLARILAEAWPQDVTRSELLARAFRARQVDESHRARLRVEIGRLRKALATLASIRATRDGFAICLHSAGKAAVLAPPTDDPHAAVLSLLADGETWSSSGLALALGASQRTVQRALDELTEESRVRPIGRGRARRWMAPPVPGFPTTLLLLDAMPG